MTSWQDKFLKDGTFVLIQGEGYGGMNLQWAIALIEIEKYSDFMIVQPKGDFYVEDYGQLIASGEGEKPSEAEVLKIKQRHKNIDFNFEEKLEKYLAEILESN